MAVDLESITATIKQSIACVQLYTDAARSPDDWALVIIFEDGLYDADGKLLQPPTRSTRTVVRRFGDIKSDPDIVALVTKIKEKSYAYRAEDIANQ